MNTLYFSEKCNHCQKLMSENNLKDYEFVNVDLQMHNLPQYVTMVPTIVTADKQSKYEGKAAFAYVQHTSVIEPYAFNCSNNTNRGFSFITSSNPVYSEQTNYSSIN